jgi:hypothetical protein
MTKVKATTKRNPSSILNLKGKLQAERKRTTGTMKAFVLFSK